MNFIYIYEFQIIFNLLVEMALAFLLTVVSDGYFSLGFKARRKLK